MPELPEVETMARDLNRLVKGRKVINVWENSPSQISVVISGSISYKGKVRDRLNLAASENNRKLFRKSLVGLKIQEVSRRAKNILIYLSGNKILLIHPKMTGHLLVGKWEIKDNRPIPLSPPSIREKINSYIHLLLVLDNGKMIGFSDARKFGKILLGEEEAILKTKDLRSLGPEPLEKEFNLELFRKIVRSSRGKIKQFLLNQEKIAGIGNIYADEILWETRLHPLHRVEKLTDKEIKKVFEAIKNILTRAVEYRGTSKTDYRDPSGKKGGYEEHLIVYGKRGGKCRRCGTKIERIVVAARSSHFCPRCQK